MSRNRPENVHPILIVEDDELMRASLEDRLRLEGFAVSAVATFDGAKVELTRGLLPHLVITDVRLPDRSGADVLELCKDKLPGVPVIVMTSFALVADAVRLIKAGALDYLEKPFNLDDFVERVRMTVSGAERSEDTSLRDAIEDAERVAIIEGLVHNDWAISKTAQFLGISRYGLWKKMRRYQISRH